MINVTVKLLAAEFLLPLRKAIKIEHSEENPPHGTFSK